jgi:lipid-A-disaccharide synthase-like uncharacterized protein
MKFVRAGLFEFLLFAAIVVVLIAAHSSRLDGAMVIAWALLLIGGSARLIYKGFVDRNDPVALNRAVTGRWSIVLPTKVVRWMRGRSDKTNS